MPAAKRIQVTDAERAALRAIGRRVGDLRHEQGMTQAELARRSGIHRNYISRLETGESNVHAVSLLRIAAALNVSLSELLAIQNS